MALPKFPPTLPQLPPLPFSRGSVGYSYDETDKCWWRVRVLKAAKIRPAVKEKVAKGAKEIYTAKILEGKLRGQVITLNPEEIKTPQERSALQSPEDKHRCWQEENLRLTSGKTVHTIAVPPGEKEEDRLAKWVSRAFPQE